MQPLEFIERSLASAKSMVKIALQSRPLQTVKQKPEGGRVIIMGNGPSLADNIREDLDFLRSAPSIAVNYAALTPEFELIKPAYYVLADPHFFKEGASENQQLLCERMRHIDWPVTLFVPAKYLHAARKMFTGVSEMATYNGVGVEGFEWLQNFAFGHGLGMPRPRNVLIPSIMTAISLGFKEIIILGADHSWTKSLDVSDSNEVVTVQPHFYAENEKEEQRIRHVFKDTRLHTVLESFAIAFRSYHSIAAYAKKSGVDIINATPGSFIDAFPRRKVSELK